MLSKPQLSQIRDWFKRKIDSLERDSYRAFTDKIEVTHLLGAGAAPFPIVLFCMATLDFFSAAYLGYSEQKRNPNRINQTDRMTEFLNKYLKYDKNISKIALEIFRHKMVHLAEPIIQIGRSDKIRGWEIASIQADGDHWTIVKFDSQGNKLVRFGVNNFISDLRKGILEQEGYLQDLEKDPQLQKNYLSFWKEIN